MVDEALTLEQSDPVSVSTDQALEESDPLSVSILGSTAAMAKRALPFAQEDYPQPKAHKELPLSPSKLSSPAKKAQVEGIILSISKGSGNFWEGELTDGCKVSRIVLFEKSQYETLRQFHDSKQSCLLKNCQISTAKNKPEIIIKTSTRIDKSPTVFNLCDPEHGSPIVNLADLPNFEDYDRVTVNITVIKVKEPVTVGSGKICKQECTVADATGKAQLVLWKENINSLVENKSYTLRRFQVHKYGGNLQLQLPRAGSEVVELENPIPDIPQFSSDEDDPNTSLLSATNLKVIGVHSLDVVHSCLGCKSGIESCTSTMTICKNCNMAQLLIDPKVTAKLLLLTQEGNKITLRAYTDELKQIIGHTTMNEPITMAMLLTAQPFNVSYNAFHVIRSVSRD